MKILFVGEIVAKPGRKVVKEKLPEILSTHEPDLVVTNVENVAHGRGATAALIKELQDAGIGYFTGGDHLFWNKEFESEIEGLPVIRPANYPDETPGDGYKLVDAGGKKVLLINLMGRTFLNERLDDPFRKADEILAKFAEERLEAVVVDFHAEATSEKYAMGFYLDGRVAAVLGTHTHVPTCDARILPGGTAFVGDVGMCGNVDSVLGVRSSIIIDLYLSGRNQRFEWEEEGRVAFRSVLLEVTDGRVVKIERVDR